MSDLVTASSSSSRALVVPESLSPVKPKHKEIVLDEDTYIDSLSQIIQRDFYPDLPKLQAQLEWMKAEQVNDVEKMRELQQRMLSSRRPTTGRATPGVRTPRNAPTPKGFETPSGATPRSASHASASYASAQDDEPSAPQANLNMSLDKFVDKHTSEDDASFVGIMDKQHEKHQEKYGWVENKANEAAVMLIEATKKDETGHFPALQSWSYTVKNQLMYVPDGEDASKLMPPPPGPPKEILHRNTRISTNPNMATAAAVRKGDREAVWAMMAAADPRQPLAGGLRKPGVDPNAKVDLSDLLGTPKTAESPKVGGYGFVATPSPAPGVDMSPITTWGRLDGTPLLIDPMETPLDLTPGPAFKLPETPRREELAMKLADKANKSQKSRIRAHAQASPYARPSASPARGAVNLSAAGRTLMERKMSARKGTIGADLQLRASYSSPAHTGSGSGVGGSARRGLVTPSPVPSPSPAPSPRATKAPTPSHSSSITDNLLDIPSGSGSKKGKSITDDLLSI